MCLGGNRLAKSCRSLVPGCLLICAYSPTGRHRPSRPPARLSRDLWLLNEVFLLQPQSPPHSLKLLCNFISQPYGEGWVVAVRGQQSHFCGETVLWATNTVLLLYFNRFLQTRGRYARGGGNSNSTQVSERKNSNSFAVVTLPLRKPFRVWLIFMQC